jgi:DNA-binding response OmpR family regulator
VNELLGKGGTWGHPVRCERQRYNSRGVSEERMVGMNESQQPRRVLIVEDAPELRRIVNRLLSRAGHETGTAVDGKDGLEKFGEGEWDLVVTDLQMPVMNGEEMAAAMKARQPEVPVIIVTGRPDLIQDHGLFCACLVKPYLGVEFMDTVDAVLSRAA